MSFTTPIYGNKWKLVGCKLLLVPYLEGVEVIKPQEILAKRINDLCKEKGMSYYSLSYKSAVPITTLMHIVDCSTKNPGLFTICKLCSGFDITLQEFFEAEEFKGIENEESSGE